MPSSRPGLRIAVTGRFRRGKDTLVDTIERVLGDEVFRLAFAEPLKMEGAYLVSAYQQLPLVQAGVPFSKVKVDELYEASLKDRELWGLMWQFWGEFRRRQNPDYWINQATATLGFIESSTKHDGKPLHLAVTDMRHHNESAWCKANGFYRVRVSGPCRTADGSEPRDPNHPSERHIDDLEVDTEFYNTGTLDDMRMGVVEHLLPRVRGDAE